MKRLTMMALAVALMASCSKEEGATATPESTNVVAFSAGEISRVSSDGRDNWESGDAIGIFTDGFDDVDATDFANVKYLATTGSDFGVTGFAFDSSVEGAKQILYPNVESGDVTFYAYYPYGNVVSYNSSTSNYAVTVFNSFSGVSQNNDYGCVDFMTASIGVDGYGVGSSVNDDAVAFSFKHNLAKVVLNITCNDNLPALTGLTTEITKIYDTKNYDKSGAAVTGSYIETNLSYNLTTEVHAVDTEDSDITNDVPKATVTAILHPMAVDDCANAKLTFTVGERTFDVAFNVALTAGSIHTFDIALGNDVPVLSGSTIQPWQGENNTSDELYSKENE